MYAVIMFVMGVPILLGEFAIGRSTQLSPVAAFQKIHRGSIFIGVLSIISPFIIMTYYGIVGGWAMKYMFAYMTTGTDPDFIKLVYTGELAMGVWQPVIWTLAFLFFCWVICLFGVKGIEKACKWLLPVFFILLLTVAIRGLTLPGSGAGVAFMFGDLSGFSMSAIPIAMGQVFFSLSLAMGIMITYGSYTKKDANLPKDTATVAGLDFFVSMISGFAVFPAVFALGGSPRAGAGLVFLTLPGIFEAMPAGRVIAVLFFLLLATTALTSAISLTEACTSSLIDSFKMNRKLAITLTVALFMLFSIPNALSQAQTNIGGIFGFENPIWGQDDLFDLVDHTVNTLVLPVCGLLSCIFIGWIWKPENAIKEIEANGTVFKLKNVWSAIIKYIAPVLIVIVLVFGFMA